MKSASPAPLVDVLYDDNHLLALNKPAGLLTQPSGSSLDNLEDRAKAYIKETRNKPGKVFLHAVHRLDRVVSGIALFARTDKSLSRMNGEMRSRRITRIYHAVIDRDLPLDQGELVHFLRHSRLRAEQASEHEPGAKRACLGYRMIARAGGLSLVEVTLETGRYHQIRAQLAVSGCPIVGDALYGSTAPYVPGGIALHHRLMGFLHPVLKSRIIIEAAYPAAWPITG